MCGMIMALSDTMEVRCRSASEWFPRGLGRGQRDSRQVLYSQAAGKMGVRAGRSAE